METETQLVKKFYLKKTSRRDATHKTAAIAGVKSTHSASKDKELRLPDYVLDFGHVILGDVKTHVLCATNIGFHPISFTIDDARLKGTGIGVFLADILNKKPATYSTLAVMLKNVKCISVSRKFWDAKNTKKWETLFRKKNWTCVLSNMYLWIE